MNSWRRLILFGVLCFIAWRVCYPVQVQSAGFKPGRVQWDYIWDEGADIERVNWGAMAMQFGAAVAVAGALWIIPVSDGPRKENASKPVSDG